ncbi:MAG: alpha-amylase family glycosyl hydrolase, partial [Pseudonocardiaceae bacterium]
MTIYQLGDRFGIDRRTVSQSAYQIESERDRVNAETRSVQESFTRRAQAALVSAWWGESRDGRWGAFVRNASETPVYQAYLTVLDSDDHSDGIKFHHLVVPPSDDVLFCPVDNDRPTQLTTARRVKLSFTDAAGVRWLRNQYGRLTELQPNLCIKTDSNRAAVLAQFEDDFLATYGVTVTFGTDAFDHPQQRFVANVQFPSVADALVCPHDWIGDLIFHDVIEPVAAFERLREFGEAGTGMIRRSMDRAEAIELFVTGRSPYLMTTSDALQRIRQTEIQVAISAVPAFADGEPASAFTLVHGLVMAKHGTNKIIAHDLFADYCNVDPRFGTLEDFDTLVTAAAALGIRLIIDIVPNHCSSRHPWFQKALDAAPGSAARERFIFRDAPNNWESHLGGSAWTRATDGQWYL